MDNTPTWLSALVLAIGVIGLGMALGYDRRKLETLGQRPLWQQGPIVSRLLGALPFSPGRVALAGVSLVVCGLGIVGFFIG